MPVVDAGKEESNIPNVPPICKYCRRSFGENIDEDFSVGVVMVFIDFGFDNFGFEDIMDIPVMTFCMNCLLTDKAENIRLFVNVRKYSSSHNDTVCDIGEMAVEQMIRALIGEGEYEKEGNPIIRSVGIKVSYFTTTDKRNGYYRINKKVYEFLREDNQSINDFLEYLHKGILNNHDALCKMGERIMQTLRKHFDVEHKKWKSLNERGEMLLLPAPIVTSDTGVVEDEEPIDIKVIREAAKDAGFTSPTNEFYAWYRDNIFDYSKNTYIETAKKRIAKEVFGTVETDVIETGLDDDWELAKLWWKDLPEKDKVLWIKHWTAKERNVFVSQVTDEMYRETVKGHGPTAVLWAWESAQKRQKPNVSGQDWWNSLPVDVRQEFIESFVAERFDVDIDAVDNNMIKNAITTYGIDDIIEFSQRVNEDWGINIKPKPGIDKSRMIKKINEIYDKTKQESKIIEYRKKIEKIYLNLKETPKARFIGDTEQVVDDIVEAIPAITNKKKVRDVLDEVIIGGDYMEFDAFKKAVDLHSLTSVVRDSEKEVTIFGKTVEEWADDQDVYFLHGNIKAGELYVMLMENIQLWFATFSFKEKYKEMKKKEEEEEQAGPGEKDIVEAWSEKPDKERIEKFSEWFRSGFMHVYVTREFDRGIKIIDNILDYWWTSLTDEEQKEIENIRERRGLEMTDFLEEYLSTYGSDKYTKSLGIAIQEWFDNLTNTDKEGIVHDILEHAV